MSVQEAGRRIRQVILGGVWPADLAAEINKLDAKIKDDPMDVGAVFGKSKDEKKMKQSSDSATASRPR